MKTEALISQLELYSNSIVGFLVIQSIGFAFTMGTNKTFSCLLVTEHGLAGILIFHFVFSTLLATLALIYLSRSIRRLSDENRNLVRWVYRGKAVAAALFAAIPVCLLIGYGTPLFGARACAA